uniref:B-like cyclin n=1 Tax=Kalanchoe fedtschenkoi TaxID=63787 RepID=A0A7N0VB72_KALFE
MNSAVAENNPVFARTTGLRGRSEMEGGKKFMPAMRRQRRALGVINQNVAGTQPPNHSGRDKISDLTHRPITRKFGQQSANGQQQQQGPLVCNKSIAGVSNSVGSEPISVYIDDFEQGKTICPSDASEPMSLEKHEVDEMEEIEIEMEDADEEKLVMDIDGPDARDPLAVADYVEHLYSYYRKMENESCESPEYMAHQDDINERMRAILIDWLIEVHDKFELMSETLFLTVNLIDRFLAEQQVVRKKLQLVGLVSMLLACKYEEVAVPAVSDLIFISDKAYARQEILEMERLMLNKLQFNVSLPTPYVFMRRFLKAARSEKKLEVLSFFLMELCLVEYEMLKFPPSLLAASAIYTAQCTLYGFPQWTRTCEWHTSYSEHQLQECSKLMVTFHRKAGTGKLTAVYRKYCAPKYGEAAQFLVEGKV